MGVNGLWKLLEASGKPVPVETLENKVLAVDVSIWLHQLTKGGGGAVQNAHLIGLYHRILKLLFFKIKPVFVFDGGVPELKKQTIAQRKTQKSKAASNAEQVRSDLLKNLLEQQLVSDVLGRKEMVLPPPALRREEDMFELPPAPKQSSRDDEEDSESEDAESSFRYADLHSVDINSEQFSALPPNMRHEILTELLEQRKLSSWHKMHEMPQESDGFSSYQMERLLRRRAIQKKLDETAGELEEHVLSLGELESMFVKEGVLARRVASNANERVVYHTKDSKASTSASSSQSQNSEEKTEDNLLDVEERDILDMIREEEENEKELDKKEGFGEEEEAEEKSEKIPIKVTREMLAEQHKILNSIVKKKAKTVPVVDITEDCDLMFDETEMIEQSQILASIQQERQKSNRAESRVFSESVEITIHDEELSKKTAKTAENMPQSNKVIEITLDPNKIKEVIGNDEDIFSDVFSTIAGCKESNNEITEPNKDDEDVIMSDTSSESSDDVAMSNNISTTTKDIHKEVLKTDFNNENNKAAEFEDISEEKDVVSLQTSLVKEIFDDLDEASGEEDAIMSDSSDSSVEDLSKVCEFISECTNKTAEKTGQTNQYDTSHVNTSKIKERIDEIATPCKMRDNVNDVIKDNIDGTVCKSNSKNNIDEIVTNVHKSSGPNKTNQVSPSPEKQAQSSSSQNSSKPPSSHSETNESNRSKIEETKSVSPKVSKSSSTDARTIDSLETSPSTSVSAASLEESPCTSYLLPSTSSIPSDPTPSTSASTSNNILLDPSTSVAVSTIKQILSSNDSSEKQSSSFFQASTSVSGSNQASTSKKESYFKTSLNETQTKKLLEYQSTLERDRDSLLVERGKQTRLASTITQQMSAEAQELLSLFGVPYIIAPGEAEAQCAGLEMCSLTQGVITDDSDIWLFGGNTVYKNFFDQKSHVLRYTAPDIRYYFELTREKLIQLALLVGSDYTPGLSGVGPVTALEILAKFSPPGECPSPNAIVDSMRRFRQWLSKKNKPESLLSKKLRNVKPSDDFPNASVIQAYLKPQVHATPPPLKWGTPDLDGLRRFASAKFGWSPSRLDQTLLPIMKKIAQRSDQTTLDMFYKNRVVIPKRVNPVSKRVRSAVDKSKSKRTRQDLDLSESDSD
uniref:DNA repair protein complementing XP-G cells homolog n=1 Tax=Cacopsylla melanoneura TaxID=428564 RepID=A0A8D9BTU3_9HEMI